MACSHRKRESHGSSSRHVKRQGSLMPTRHYSRRQEDQVAKATGGLRQKNSGATMWEKGDVVAGDILIECKTKVSPSKSISIKKEWLQKNSEEALFMGKPYSAIAFNFGPDEPNYYIIDEPLMNILADYISSHINNK